MDYVHLDTNVTRDELLQLLKKQLEDMKETYKIAKRKWREKMLLMALKITEAGDKLKKFPRALSRLTHPPISYVKELEELIGRIERHTGHLIELGSEDYEKMVLGRWSWRGQYDMSNRLYGATGSTGPTGGPGEVGETGLTGDGEIVAEITEDEVEK